jgi:protein-tyrosine-phosphatase
MAEALFMSKLASRNVDEVFNVQSAGTWGEDGLPAAPEAVQALLQRGIDLSQHRSRIITVDIIDEADLILTMERNHTEALVTEFPQKENQIFMLAEMVDQSNDIADPMQQPIEAFVKTADELDGIIDLGFEKILQMSKAF